MTSYAVSDPEKPWVMLFCSARLDAIAEALAAQPQISTSAVYATLDGKPRSLTAEERVILLECVLEVRPGNSTAVIELALARREADTGAHISDTA
jgi:hypothetical protein